MTEAACQHDPFSSRMCEHGTKGCTVHHCPMCGGAAEIVLCDECLADTGIVDAEKWGAALLAEHARQLDAHHAAERAAHFRLWAACGHLVKRVERGPGWKCRWEHSLAIRRQRSNARREELARLCTGRTLADLRPLLRDWCDNTLSRDLSRLVAAGTVERRGKKYYAKETGAHEQHD